MHQRFVQALLVGVCCAGAAPLPAPPAPPPQQPFVENLWGTKVTDRYRYFENPQDRRAASYLNEQNAYTRSVLRSLGEPRDRLAARIRELDRSSTSVGGVVLDGRLFFYNRQNPQAETPRLYVRAVDGKTPRVLVDPAAGAHAASHRTIDWSLPSFDGRYVAYGISSGGSENSVLSVVDVTTGKTLPERISRTRFGASTWLPDNRSFVYLRLPATTASTPITERERYAKAYVHRVGTPVAADRALFGYRVDPAITVAPDDIPQISISPASPYAIAALEHGVRNELTLYTAPVSTLSSRAVHWRKIADVADGVTGYDLRGSTIYLLTHRNAPNFAVRTLDLAHAGARPRSLVTPPGKAVLAQVAVARDALYLRLLDGGIGRIVRRPFDAPAGAALEPVKLPNDGAVIGMTADSRDDGVAFGLTGWTRSLLWYRSDAAGAIKDTALKPLSPIDARPYTSVEVKAYSRDGTAVPLSIIFKRGIKLDGSHPAYLEGYGAYGITLDPYFSATRIAWLERGGIYAVAHVRGGGEYGDAWHRAAMTVNKVRSIDDFIACAEYLVAHGYTSPDHLGGEGTSAGGIVIGGAITRRPDLFAGALDVVGVSDALRSEFSANGPSNIPEFGTIKKRDEFRTLLAIDAYQQVRDGEHYPGVMLVTGKNDPRVPSWELAKFAARLQSASTSGRPVLLRVDYDGGHGFLASSRTQTESLLTDEYAFLLWQLGDPAFSAIPPVLGEPAAASPSPVSPQPAETETPLP